MRRWPRRVMLAGSLLLVLATTARAIDLDVDVAGGNSPYLIQSPQSWGNVRVGLNQGGLIQHFSNLLNAGGDLIVGATANGTYDFQNGSINASRIFVGTQTTSTGNMTQSAGTTTASYLEVGQSGSSAGSYGISGGSFTVGSAALYANGTGVVKLAISGTAAGTVTGDLLLANAGLSVSGGGRLSAGSISVSGAGVITIADPNGTTSALTIGDGNASSLTATVQNGASAGGITKVGLGTVTIPRVQPFTGPTRVQAGTLTLDNTSSLSTIINTASAITVTNSTLHLQGLEFNVILNNPLTVGVGGKVETGSSVHNAQTLLNVTLAGGEMANTAPPDAQYGNYVLTGTLTANGGVGSTISAAKFQLNGARIFDVASSSSLTVTSTADLTNTNNNTQIGSLTKTGPGTLTLNGSVSYTGGTTVSAGTLNNNGPMAGAVTVNGTSVLGGAGTFSGAVAMSSGTTLAPGNASVGALTANTLALAASSKLTYEFKAGGNDFVNVTANNGLTINGGAITLYAEGTTNPASISGAFDLMGYAGTLGGAVSNLSVANPVAGGTYVFTNDAARHRIVLTVGGTAPTITSINNATFQTGVPGSFTVTTTGFPFPTITRTGNALPTGVTLTSNGDGTATLAGTPAAGTGGLYTFTVNAQNSAGSATPQAFTLTVNEPAAITSVNAATFTVGTAGSFTVTKSGYPSPTVMITAGTLPSALTFVNDVLSGTPAGGTGGVRSLTFTATNGIGTAGTQSFTLTVNEAPAITSASSTTFQTGVAGTFNVIASGFPAPAMTSTGTLPTGVNFTGGNGTASLAGTAAANTGGLYSITINAQNTAGSAPPQTFTLTVNQPAAITTGGPPPASGVVGTAYAGYTFAATGYPTPTFAVSAGSLPPGITLSTVGVLAGTPTTAGTFAGIKVRAMNSTGNPETTAFTITITPRLYNSLTTVTTSGSPSAQSDPVTFTATVVPNETGAPPAVNGNVQFFDGATPLICSESGNNTRTLNASGQAACTTSALTSAGSPHTINANFQGDPTGFNPSSGSVMQTVGSCDNLRTVTSLGDGGAGSLRQALVGVCGGGTITFNLPPGPQAIGLTSGEIVLDRNVTITGPGASLLTVQRANGAGTFRIFRSAPGVTATISGLTISGGDAGFADGGGVLSDRSNLTLSQCVISGNHASSNGGGLANITNVSGSPNESGLTLQNCLVTGNTATGGFGNLGGGIVSRAGNGASATLIITGSTVEGNIAGNGGGGIGFDSANGGTSTAQISGSTINGNSLVNSGAGGGIYAQGAATLSLANSTVHGNRADDRGAGIYLNGVGALPHAISNCTITANINGFGGGIGIDNTGLALNNCIVADNAGSKFANDLYGVGYSGSYNLIGTSDGGYVFTGGAQNLFAVDPRLQKDGNGIPLLANNGGPTKTVLLLPDSPAADRGLNSVFDNNSNPIPFDQRGQPRPIRYDPTIPLPSGGDGSDIGAVELATIPRIAVEQPVGVPLVNGASTTVFGVVPTGSNSSRIFTVRNAGLPDLTLGAITVTGPNMTEFVAGEPGATTLTAGDSTTFTVVFSPTASGPRTAVLHLASNAPGVAASFDIDLSGGVPSSNADLFALALTQGILTPTFSGATIDYSATVPNSAASITVTPTTVADTNATITVNGNPVVSGSPSGPIVLAIGQNNISIVVTAEDGTTTKTYTVTVDRQRYASATAVTSSRNPSAVGAAIAFTAAVTPNAAGAPPMASGTVQFFDGATPLVCSTNSSSVQPLDGNGRATCTTSTLSINGSPHTIQAQYSGDGDFATSAGSVSQLITACPLDATVTSIADDGSPGTLRDVIGQVCPGSVVQFDLGPGPHIIDLTTAELLLTKNVTILGPGASQLTVRRSLDPNTPSFRIFNIAPGVTAAISGLTIANGAAFQSQSGGGVLLQTGDLTLSDCVVTGNTADGAGGGIGSGFPGPSVVTVTNCVISGNTAQFGGAAITNDTSSSTATVHISNSTLSGNMGGQSGSGGAIRNTCIDGLAVVQIANCTFTGNSSGQFGSGGAIYNLTQGSGTASVQMDNSTLSGNSAGSGGAIFNYAFGSGHATTLVNNSTIVGNTAGTFSFSGGGGIYNFNRVDNDGGGTPTVTLQNSIVANNSAPPDRGPDILNSDGEVNGRYSLIRDITGFTFTSNVLNIIGVDPLLGPLQNNGGPTFTRALLAGSPAINAGDDLVAPPLDQRGYARSGISDIGAFEFNGGAPSLQILSVVSRKTHGAEGLFDLPLPLTGPAGIECRASGAGGSHQVVVTFASPILALGSVSVTSRDGLAAAQATLNGAILTLELSSVANAQTLAITLGNVSNGLATGDIVIPMSLLLGDATGDGAVTASDIGQTKSFSGANASASSYRTDINASGTTDSTDISQVKSLAGTVLPPAALPANR